MPKHIRCQFSNYYFNWGNAFSQETYRKFAREAFSLSITYNPLDIRAWLYYFVTFLPLFIQRGLLKIYKAMKNENIQQ